MPHDLMSYDPRHVDQEECHGAVLKHATVALANDLLLDVLVIGTSADTSQVLVQARVERHVARLAGELSKQLRVISGIGVPALYAERSKCVDDAGDVGLCFGDAESFGLYSEVHSVSTIRIVEVRTRCHRRDLSGSIRVYFHVPN